MEQGLSRVSRTHLRDILGLHSKRFLATSQQTNLQLHLTCRTFRARNRDFSTTASHASKRYAKLYLGNKDQTTPDYWKLPREGGWDCDFHIFDPSSPFSPTRSFTPSEASWTSYLDFNADISRTRTPSSLVLVQPSVYGTDNSLLLKLLEENSGIMADSERDLRGIVALDVSTVTDEELWNMHALGVRGVRISLPPDGRASDLNKEIMLVANRLRRLNTLKCWLIQLRIPGELWEDIADTVSSVPFRFIADHYGGMKAVSMSGIKSLQKPRGLNQLLELAKTGKVFIKISAPYRSSTDEKHAYQDTQALLKNFAYWVPDSLIWGSDWPHTRSPEHHIMLDGIAEEENGIAEEEPFREVNFPAWLKMLKRYMGYQAWIRMISRNPEKLFK